MKNFRAFTRRALPILALLFASFGEAWGAKTGGDRPLAIVGATLVDLSDFGRSSHDVRDAVVIVEKGRITAAGPRAKVRVPRGSVIVDAHGKFLVPGLIDGFASQANQSFASAYLAMGVTSVVAALPSALSGQPPDPRRSDTFTAASPSPRLFFMGIVSGYAWESDTPRLATEDEVRADVKRLAQAGAKVLLLYYPLRPGPLRAAATQARELGVATIGELGSSTYYEGQAAGVDAFVHTPRYSLELAAPELRQQVAEAPFGPPRKLFYEALNRLTPDDPRLAEHARKLGAGPTLLIPTLSLLYLEIPGHENPWNERTASLLDPKDIHLPADRVTGEQAPPPDAVRDAFPPDTWRTELMLEDHYRQAGARYLTGSGTSAFGTMPGISLHTELGLLVRIGLTPRQALAAATTNWSTLAPWRELGAIIPGREADLLLLDADPTVDIRNARKIHKLFIGGREIDRERLLGGANQ